MENTITKIIESISLYAQSIRELKLIVKQTIERTEKVYIVDKDGKEHFYHNSNVSRERKIVEYPLMEISVDDVQQLRNSSNPVFLYKENYKLYYTEMPARLHIVELLAGDHQCASANIDCKRLSAETDERGGCKKVRDRNLKLENYPFIKKGYQVINTTNNCFVVLECAHFDPISAKTIRNENLANVMEIASTYWKNFRGLEDTEEDKIFPE